MTLLQSWKESLKMLVPSKSNMFIPVAKKAIVESCSLLYKYFWWLLVSIVGLAIVLPAEISVTIIPLLTLLCQFFVVLSARESMEYKDWSYFKKNIKKLLAMLVIASVFFLIIAALTLFIFQLIGRMTNQDSPAILGVVIAIIYIIIVLISVVALSSINPYAILFFLDKSAETMHHHTFDMMINSIKQGVRFIVYNVPFLLALGLAHAFFTFWYITNIIILLFSMALQVAVYNYRTKHQIDRASHYYARHDFEG